MDRAGFFSFCVGRAHPMVPRLESDRAADRRIRGVALKVSQTRLHERSGLTFTAVGFGGAPIGNFNGVSTESAAADMVAQSWEQGVRYFDTAPGYGNGLSEYRLGHALRNYDRSRLV